MPLKMEQRRQFNYSFTPGRPEDEKTQRSFMIQVFSRLWNAWHFRVK